MAFEIEKEHKKYRFGRCVSAMAWPGMKRGYAVIVAETAYPRCASGKEVYDYYILAEYESWIRQEIFDHLLQWKTLYKPVAVLARYELSEMNSLEIWNRKEKPEGIENLNVWQAPYSDRDSVNFMIETVRECVSVNDGTIHWIKEKLIESDLRSFSIDEYCNAKEADQPRLAALGYCMIFFRENPPEREEDATQRKDMYDFKGY